MEIGKNYKIESDEMNVILSKRCINQKTKAEYWTNEGYYATPKEALHDLVNMKVRETKLIDLKTVVAEMDKLHELISSLKL